MIIFEPLEDNVLLEIEQPEEKTRTGILLPEKSRESTRKAKVIGCGPGKTSTDGKKLPMPVNIGDYVALNRHIDYSNDTIKIEDTEYTIVPLSMILGIIREKRN